MHRLLTTDVAPDSELVAEAVDLLAVLYRLWGKTDEAARWREQEKR